MRASRSYSLLASLPLLLACDKTMPAPEGPAIQLETTELAFGGVEYGTQPQQLLRVKNIGQRPLSIAKMESDAKELSAAAPGLSINPESAIDVTVTFDARRRNSAHGTLSITSDDPQHPVVTVKWTATASAQSICAIDATVRLLEFTEAHTERTVYITNSGTAPCTVLSITTSTASTFAVQSPSAAPFELAPASSSEVTLMWRNRRASVVEGLTIASDDPREPLLAVELVGISYFATHPCFSLFGPNNIQPAAVGSTATSVISLAPLSPFPCALDSIDFNGDREDGELSWILWPKTSPGVLDGPQRIYVFFRPNHTGPFLADWVVHAYGMQASVALAGEAYEPTLCIEPRDVDLSGGTAVITVSACKGQQVFVSRMVPDPPDPRISVDPENPPLVWLDPGESRTIRLRSNTSTGAIEGRVLIESGSPHNYHQYVRFTAGGQLVPPSAGRYLELDDRSARSAQRLALQGGNQTSALFPHDRFDTAAASSSDGRFISSFEQLGGTLRIYDRDGNTDSTIAADVASPLAWRPGPSGTPAYPFAFSDGGAIHIGSPFANEALYTLTPTASAFAGTPAWGPHGTIAFVRQHGGLTNLVIADEDGSAFVEAAWGLELTSQPAFSPDGRWIAVDIAGGGIRLFRTDDLHTPLDRPFGFDAHAPAFSLDGRYFAYATGGEVKIVAIDPETMELLGEPITVWTGFDLRRLAFSR